VVSGQNVSMSFPGTIARISRGAPAASLETIDMPRPVAFWSIGVTVCPSSEAPGGPGSSGGVDGESPLHAAANSNEGTTSARNRKSMEGLSVDDAPDRTTAAACQVGNGQTSRCPVLTRGTPPHRRVRNSHEL